MGIRVTKETLQAAARDHRPAGLPQAAVPPGDPERPDPALDRRRHRPVAHDHAPAAQGAPRRSQRHGVAEAAQGHLREEEHPRAGVGPSRGVRRTRPAARVGCPASGRPVCSGPSQHPPRPGAAHHAFRARERRARRAGREPARLPARTPDRPPGRRLDGGRPGRARRRARRAPGEPHARGRRRLAQGPGLRAPRAASTCATSSRAASARTARACSRGSVSRWGPRTSCCGPGSRPRSSTRSRRSPRWCCSAATPAATARRLPQSPDTIVRQAGERLARESGRRAARPGRGRVLPRPARGRGGRLRRERPGLPRHLAVRLRRAAAARRHGRAGRDRRAGQVRTQRGGLRPGQQGGRVHLGAARDRAGARPARDRRRRGGAHAVGAAQPRAPERHALQLRSHPAPRPRRHGPALPLLAGPTRGAPRRARCGRRAERRRRSGSSPGWCAWAGR